MCKIVCFFLLEGFQIYAEPKLRKPFYFDVFFLRMKYMETKSISGMTPADDFHVLSPVCDPGDVLLTWTP